MRGTEYLVLVVFMGIMAMSILFIAQDFNTIYTDNSIDTSNFSQFNDFNRVANRANETFENFKTLGDDSKWYQKIGAGIVAIPYAVISFPVMIGDSVVILTKFMGISLAGIIPQPIIYALVVLMIIEIVRRLLEFFQRSRA